jgi:hypothetical protein
MTITTPAFQSGQAIPAKYTCEGADISPPARAKRKLAMSETACIEAALRLWFRKEGIE